MLMWTLTTMQSCASVSNVFTRGHRHLHLFIPLFIVIVTAAVSCSDGTTDIKRDVWKTPLAVPDFEFAGSDAAAKNCGLSSQLPLFLVFVCSALENFERRQTIRETWGGQQPAKTESDAVIQVLFLVGQSGERNDYVNELSSSVEPHDSHEYSSVQSALKAEMSIYGDVIQASFIDSYVNLTLKSVAMLQWTTTYCPGATYLIKMDDDAFINMPLLVNDLRHTVHHRFIMGNVIAAAAPVRNRLHKWYTPPALYAEPFYPTYVSGAAYVISGDLVLDLHRAALNSRTLFWIEDIFVTGILAKSVHAMLLYNGKFDWNKPMDEPCQIRSHILRHRLSTSDIRTLWQIVAAEHSDRDVCS